MERYRRHIAQSNQVVEEADNLEEVGTRDDRTFSLRWVILHMIEETARHAGHSDIYRELMNGTTG